jgi:hypothetical protein
VRERYASILAMYRALARLALRRHRTILAVSGVVLMLAGLVLWRGGTLSSGTTEGIEADVAQQLVSRELGYPAESSFIVVFRGRDGLVWKDPRTRPAMTAALAGLRADPSGAGGAGPRRRTAAGRRAHDLRGRSPDDGGGHPA